MATFSIVVIQTCCLTMTKSQPQIPEKEKHTQKQAKDKGFN